MTRPMRTSAYLDYNATAPIWPEALAAVTAALAAGGNPSSVHEAGRKARRGVERARAGLLAAFGAGPGDDLVFTSGGTEANHLVLTGCRRTRLLVSAVEHDSILANAGGAEILPVSAAGIVDPALLQRRLAADPTPALVSIMGANNETGILQPVALLAAVCREAGALFHVDAVQMPGKVPLDFQGSGADLMTVSAHKIGGPPGVGALLLRAGVEVAPALRGGGQERGRRAGTENAAAISGFAAAAGLLPKMLAAAPRLTALRTSLEVDLEAEGAIVVGSGSPRLPNTSVVIMPGVRAETQIIALDLAGISVSAGAACSSGKVRASHVLSAMGWEAASAGAAIRISLGWRTTKEEVAALVAAWTALRRRTNHAAVA